MRREFLGFDIGGTKILAVRTDAEGHILAQEQLATDKRGGANLVDQIEALTVRLGVGQLAGIGFGVPAAVCPHDQSLSQIPNIANMEGRRFYDLLKARFKLPICLENDVNCAAYAEAQLAQTNGSLAFIALGTGIGMGLMADGKLVRGKSGAAGEIAFLPIGHKPYIKRSLGGTYLEDALGGEGWRRAYGDEAVSLAQLFAGDEPRFESLLKQQADLLAQAILSISAVVAPEVFILGGSIGSQPRLHAATNYALADYMLNPPQVRISTLGLAAGAIGAALMTVNFDQR